MEAEKKGRRGGPGKIKLTSEQRTALAKELSFPLEAIPTEISVIGLTAEEGRAFGIPQELAGRFLPGGVMSS
jgi:hypothetical protein